MGITEACGRIAIEIQKLAMYSTYRILRILTQIFHRRPELLCFFHTFFDALLNTFF